MNIKLSLIGLFLFACIFSSGCAGEGELRAPIIPPRGLLFTNFKAPLTSNYKDTDVGLKKGEGETIYFKEPFFGTSYGFGNATIMDAAKKYNLTEITYVDYEYTSVLGIFQQVKIIPHGK